MKEKKVIDYTRTYRRIEADKKKCILYIVILILLGFLLFSGLVLTLFQGFFHFLGGFVGLALRIDRHLCAVLVCRSNLFHGGTVKAGIVAVKA